MFHPDPHTPDRVESSLSGTSKRIVLKEAESKKELPTHNVRDCGDPNLTILA